MIQVIDLKKEFKVAKKEKGLKGALKSLVTTEKFVVEAVKGIHFEIKKGETVTVEFTLTPEDMKFYNVELDYVWEPGEIQVFVGPNSKVEEYKSFELV